MDFKEKIEKICKDKNLTQKQLAEHIGVNHIVFNRNIGLNRITSDMVLGFINHLPEIDFNWLLKEEELLVLQEPSERYEIGLKPQEEIEKAIKILQNVSKHLSQN